MTRDYLGRIAEITFETGEVFSIVGPLGVDLETQMKMPCRFLLDNLQFAQFKTCRRALLFCKLFARYYKRRQMTRGHTSRLLKVCTGASLPARATLTE